MSNVIYKNNDQCSKQHRVDTIIIQKKLLQVFIITRNK